MIELSNGVRISNHHPHGRTWQQFLLEEANKDAFKEEYRVTEANPPKSFSQWWAPFNPLNL